MAVVRIVPVVSHDKDIPGRDGEQGENVRRPLVDERFRPGGSIDKQSPVADLWVGGWVDERYCVEVIS